MGVCLEFGPHITDGCYEPMMPGNQRCTCPGCGAVCQGRFQGCQEVWDRGPQTVTLVSRPATGRMATAKARSVPASKVGEQNGDPVEMPSRPATNGPVASMREEQTAATNLAKAVEETLEVVGTRLQDDRELRLRSQLESIESRLEELTIAVRQNSGLQAPSSNGGGSGRGAGAHPDRGDAAKRSEVRPPAGS